MRRPFEIFARAESEKYLNRIKVIWGFDTLNDFQKLFTYIKENAESIVTA